MTDPDQTPAVGAATQDSPAAARIADLEKQLAEQQLVSKGLKDQLDALAAVHDDLHDAHTDLGEAKSDVDAQLAAVAKANGAKDARIEELTRQLTATANRAVALEKAAADALIARSKPVVPHKIH